jgi:hypothetical protein
MCLILKWRNFILNELVEIKNNRIEPKIIYVMINSLKSELNGKFFILQIVINFGDKKPFIRKHLNMSLLSYTFMITLISQKKSKHV